MLPEEPPLNNRGTVRVMVIESSEKTRRGRSERVVAYRGQRRPAAFIHVAQIGSETNVMFPIAADWRVSSLRSTQTLPRRHRNCR